MARNRILLKNLLQLARRTLRDDGVPAPAVDTAFQPAEQFVEDRWSSHRPSDGLAVFLGPEEFRLVRVPLRLPELVTIGQRFFVRPLLPLLVAGGRFHVLSLSQDTIRLYSGTRFRLDEVELDGLPLAMWLTVPRRRDRAHAFLADRGGSGRRTVFFGGAEQDEKLLVYRHFQRVDRVSLTDPPNRDDQSDRAAVETLRNGGNVYAGPAARMPSGSPVAATFRY
jgi:hypothetical protein